MRAYAKVKITPLNRGFGCITINFPDRESFAEHCFQYNHYLHEKDGTPYLPGEYGDVPGMTWGIGDSHLNFQYWLLGRS